jgi:lipopolysaccharide biosynthesis glycosyltransferase
VTLDVAVAVEGRAYARHAHALLRSLAPWDVRVHVLHSWRLGPLARRALRRAGARTHRVPDGRVAGLPVNGPFTQAMWFRVLLGDLLPDADRVLYLDVDCLVLDDPAPLAALDLGDAWLAAVTNVPMPLHEGRAEALGVPDEAYFNSGVLLLHLAALRRDGALAEVEAYARARPELGWPDQDALNAVLHARRLPLAPRWNAMNSLRAFPAAAERLHGGAAVREALERPAIRHFEGPGANKPWDPRAAPADRELWARFTP